MKSEAILFHVSKTSAVYVAKFVRETYKVESVDVIQNGTSDEYRVVVNHEADDIEHIRVAAVRIYHAFVAGSESNEAGPWSWYEQEIFVRIHSELVEFLKPCRLSMHEPDNENVSAIVTGTRLDNAGTSGELTVHISRVDHGQMPINLASLIALARMAKIPAACDKKPE